MLITQRVQLRQDDIPLGEQTVSQVSNYKKQKDLGISQEKKNIILPIRFSIRDSICSSMVIDSLRVRAHDFARFFRFDIII